MSTVSTPPRDSKTGHRVNSDGRKPRQTRSLPPWWWPFELVGRFEARLLGRYPIDFWETT